MQRILITRLSALGDIVHSLPAVGALRQAFPAATIGWVIEERWADLLSARSALAQEGLSPARPLVDRVHTVNVRDWRSAWLSSATWSGIGTALRELRRHDYQITVDLQAAIRSALLARMSRAPQRYGFALPREAPAKWFYTTAVTTDSAHVVQQGMEMAQAISQRNHLRIEFPLPRDAQAEAWCESELQKRRVTHMVMINPGAGWGAKRWPAERYGALARRLADEGFSVLVNFGPGDEPLARAVESASGAAALPIASSLAQLIALTRRACLVIGGDTGPVHLAAALRIPVLAVYGPTDPARNGPFAPEGANVTSITVLRSPQSSTSHARHAAPERGMLEITVEQVQDAALALLRSAQ